MQKCLGALKERILVLSGLVCFDEKYLFSR